MPASTRATESRIASRLAEEEVCVLGEAQREGVGRPVREDRLPGERGVDRPAVGQRLDGGDMQPLAGRGAGKRALRRGDRADDLGMVAAKAADQEQPGDRRRAENEGRVRRKRRLQSADRIAGQAPVVRDGAVVGPGRLLGTGERQPQLIFGH